MAKRAAEKLGDYPLCGADQELKHLIRARCAFLYVVTWEERRVIDNIVKIAEEKDIEMSGVAIWDAALGMVTPEGAPVPGAESVKNLESCLDYIIAKAEEQRGMKASERKSRGPIFVICDAFRYLEERKLQATVERKIRQLSSTLLKKTTIHMVFTSPVLALPTSLEKCVTVLDYPLPGKEQLEVLVENAKKQLIAYNVTTEAKLATTTVEKTVGALMGLTFDEAEDALAKSVVKHGFFDVDTLNSIKQQIIRKGELLDYIYTEESMDNIGGFRGLKEFIRLRKKAFGKKALTYGLPVPKGVFLLGVQGTGKSLCAQAVANEFKVPLLKLDMSRMFSRYVGETEGNIRRALKLAESIAPCVLFVDEINTGLSSGGERDGGTTNRVIGYMLDWMQSKTSPVFIVAAANSVVGIPPAVLRKGRFDELFFVDLPNESERRDIFEIHIKKSKRNPADFDLNKLAGRTDKFSGAEIKAMIDEAMFMAFDEDREYTTEDVMAAVSNCTPLADFEYVKEQMDTLRDMTDKRMRKVSDALYKPSAGTTGDGSRFETMSKGE